MTNVTDALRALIADIDAEAQAELGHDSGMSYRLERFADRLREALATPAGSASGEAQRWTLANQEYDASMQQADDGEWIEYTDYAALQAEVARHKEYAADAAAAKLEAELAQRRTEAEAAVLREALLTIRDSTFRSALQLRGIADRALTAAMGSANGQG